MKSDISIKFYENVLLGTILIASLLIPLLLYIENYKILILLFSIPIFCYVLFTFESNYRLYYIFSIFFGFYFQVNARIQLVNIVSYILIIYFILNYSTSSFNKYKLPISFKYIAMLLIGAVFLSSINTPFISFWSIYYGFMFFTYIFTGYIVYRSVLDFYTLNDYLNFFFKSVAFFSCLIIISIIFTGNIRSFGISGPTIPDMIVMALLIIVFKSYISGNISKSNLIFAIIVFITLITTLSRFAWIGFILSFVYGMIIVSFLNTKNIFTKKTIYFISGLVFLVLLIFMTDLHNIIITRFLDVNFSVLDATKEEGVVSNSLDTRALIWITALNTFLQNKMTGVGYFMFYKVSAQFNILPQVLFDEFVSGLDAHSTFLNFLTETGIIGFSSIILYFISAFYYSFKSIKFSFSEESKTVSLILNIILFFVFTTSIYSGAFTFGYNAFVLHSLIGLVIINYVIIKKQNNKIENIN